MSDGKIKKVDLVESGAAKAYDELKESAKKLVVQLEALNREVSKGKTTTEQTTKARGKSNKLLTEEEKITKQLTTAQKKLALSETEEYKALIKTKKALSDKNAELRKGEKATKKQAKANKGLAATFKSLLKNMIAFIGVRMFIQFAKDTFNLIKVMDGLKFAMEKITKTAFDMASSFRFMMELSRDFGVSLVSTTERWIKFLAAAKQSGITLRDTQKIFRSMTKAGAVLGLKTDELRGIYLALEQMLSKGKVTTEELRRQLGERLPGAMGIMAASLDVTISQLDKMLKKGEVLSADALPRFAAAVEIAFGIESVTKVNTLTASQSRLTSEWQLFVKSVLSDSKILIQSFNGIASVIKGITEYFSFSAKSESAIVEKKKAIEDALFKNSKKSLDKTLKLGEKYADIKQQNSDILAKLIKAKLIKNNDDEIEELNKQLSKKTKLLLDYNDQILLISQDKAFEEIKKVEKALTDATPAFEELKEKAESFGLSIRDIVTPYGTLNNEIRRALFNSKLNNKENIKTIQNYETLVALVENYQLLIEKGTTVIPEEDEDGSAKLRQIQDLQNKIRAKELQSQIEANKKNIKAEESSFTLKKDLLERNLELEKEINDLIVEDKIDSINRKADAEIAAAGGSKTSRGIELEKERNQKLILLSQDLSAKKIQLEEKTESELDKIRKVESNKIKEQLEEQAHNLKIAKAKELAIVRSTITDRGKLAKAEADINLKFQKLGNEQLIKIYQDIIKHLKDLGIETLKLDRILEGLLNKSFAPDLSGEKEKFQAILDLARQFNDAIGDLFSAFSDRRIEAIDAEIVAEEDKYARLIQLAGDDASKKVALEQNRDAKLKILEKKRLKEEQKAARQRKAFALSDIAINTARGIMQIWANSPDPSGISQGLMTAIISALGAVQIATVLAAPIPQFAEGGVMGYDGKALINDGGRREYVERNGIIFSTPIKNAVVDLKKKDIVHRDLDAVMNASIMTSLSNDNLDINKLRLIFDDNYANLEGAITKGFNKAKINNNINLKGFDHEQEAYRNSQSRWN